MQRAAYTVYLILALTFTVGCHADSTPAAPSAPTPLGPLFTQDGTGNATFDMPGTVRTVRVTARPDGVPETNVSCSNFTVRVNGLTLLTAVVAQGAGTTCGVAGSGNFQGTYPTTGGRVQIVNAIRIRWTVTEVR